MKTRFKSLVAASTIVWAAFLSVPSTSSAQGALNKGVTCIELRATYPAGIARNKKVPGLRKYPKALIANKLYSENKVLDQDGNGVACDKGDRFDSYSTNSLQIDVLWDEKPIRLNVECRIKNFKISYGTIVGKAALDASVWCWFEFKNLDPTYSHWLGGVDPDGYLVFDDFQMQNGDTLRRPAGTIFGESFYETLGPSKSIAKGVIQPWWVDGSKAEVENLLNRIRNGMAPSLYVDFGGCHLLPYKSVRTTRVGDSCVSASLDLWDQ